MRTQTPLVEFIDKAHEADFLWVTEKPETNELIDLIKKLKIKEKETMKSMFLEGFLLGRGSAELKRDVDVEKQFNLFWFKKFEMI